MVGHRIKVFRNKLGLSQECVAEEIGVSQSTLARIETGDPKLTLSQFYMLSHLLQIDLSDLFANTKEAEPQQRESLYGNHGWREAMADFHKRQIKMHQIELDRLSEF